jgi:hypothetical protein
MTTIVLNEDLDIRANVLDLTIKNLPNKDDSMNQALTLAHKRRLSNKLEGKDLKSLNKIRNMLNNNITMKQRKETVGDNSRAEKIRKLMEVMSSSPRQGALSNIRERPINTIEVDHRNKNRHFSPALRQNAPMQSDMKNRIKQKIDMLIRHNKSNSTIDQEENVISPVKNPDSSNTYKSRFSRIKSEEDFVNQNDASGMSF